MIYIQSYDFKKLFLFNNHLLAQSCIIFKYFCLIKIICTQLCDFKYSYLMQIILELIFLIHKYYRSKSEYVYTQPSAKGRI